MRPKAASFSFVPSLGGLCPPNPVYFFFLYFFFLPGRARQALPFLFFLPAGEARPPALFLPVLYCFSAFSSYLEEG